MRWERLFADLEATFEADQRAGHDADVADLIRAERARLTVSDRLRPHIGAVLTWRLKPASGFDDPIQATLLDVGTDWILIASASGTMRRHLLIPSRCIDWIAGLSGVAQVDESQVAKRMGLTVVLRGLARDRVPVRVLTAAGQLTGTIDRVGADHLDLAMHDLEAPRRASQIREVRCIPLNAVSAFGLIDDPATI